MLILFQNATNYSFPCLVLVPVKKKQCILAFNRKSQVLSRQQQYRSQENTCDLTPLRIVGEKVLP